MTDRRRWRKRNPLSVIVTVRFTEQDAAAVAALAEAGDVTPSIWVRQAVRRRIAEDGGYLKNDHGDETGSG